MARTHPTDNVHPVDVIRTHEHGLAQDDPGPIASPSDMGVLVGAVQRASVRLAIESALLSNHP